MGNLNVKSRQIIREHIRIMEALCSDESIDTGIHTMAEWCIGALRSGQKILFCGNGGSAADAQHIAAELSGKFTRDRAPLFAEALHVNTSYLTAVANDYGFDHAYSRLVQAKAVKGDLLIGLSTSGNSANVLKAFQQAASQEVRTIAWTGMNGGRLEGQADLMIRVPSAETPRIQEAHVLIGHILCEIIESTLFG